MGGSEVLAHGRALTEDAPESLGAPIMRQIEQRLFLQSDQWALQHTAKVKSSSGIKRK